MNHTIRTIQSALKKIGNLLKSKHQSLSFLLVLGKQSHGKTAFLNQSGLEHLLLQTEPAAQIYYNQHGIVLELSASWLNTQDAFLQSALKYFNRSHRALKISGIVLCLDINALFHTEPALFTSEIKSYSQLLTRFGMALGYKTNLAIVFTKLDALAGFCDFYQNDHLSELCKPLGFSLHGIADRNQLLETYRTQFDRFIEILGQQVIHKMHPVRSTIKRSLIREFPLQLATLRVAIQAIIQNLSLYLFNIQTLYFTSAEQGGLSLDRLTKKIQSEYALSVQDTFSQATNYRAYFIEGALRSCQELTAEQTSPRSTLAPWQIHGLSAFGGLITLIFIYQYIHSSHLLENASKELKTYDSLVQNHTGNDTALYHLSKASSTLTQLSTNQLWSPTIKTLTNQIEQSTQHDMENHFIPNRLHELEQAINNNQLSEYQRYRALKIYLMLSDPKHLIAHDVIDWFKQRWQNQPQTTIEKNVSLLARILKNPSQSFNINPQIVMDARNYLNALPAEYLYYALMQSYVKDEKKPIAIEGFQLGDQGLPAMFTKPGFNTLIAQLPSIADALAKDAWVLSKPDLSTKQTVLPLLQQAYCHAYVTWWRNFLHHTTPTHAQNYQQARDIAATLYHAQSVARLIALVQQNTSPELQDHSALFNQNIANHFTKLSLVSRSTVKNLTDTLDDLAKFLSTLAIINDDGKTAFSIVRARFLHDNISNPISALYAQAEHLPTPLATWTKQIANDTWYLLINESRTYINQQWKTIVLQDYNNAIAHRYPFDNSQTQEVSITDFNRFFSTHGILTQFVELYLKPFLNTQDPQWKLKELNQYVVPISADTINELIRANIINNMFFPNKSDISEIEFNLQKITLDPVVSSLQLIVGSTSLKDTQNSDASTAFHWPEPNAKLSLNSIEGAHFELEESGSWAFFRLLQKVNVLIDEDNSANLEIHFEINGNSGRYLLKTANQINPFTPGILNGFQLSETIV